MTHALTEWATGIARQVWPECSVQITHHHDGRATFVIAPGDTDSAAFTSPTIITVPELTDMLRDAASLGAAQHLQGAGTELKRETDIAHQTGFEEGYQSGLNHGEKRGRSAQNKYALNVINGLEQRLDEARDDQVLLHKVKSILSMETDAAGKIELIEQALDKGITPRATAPERSFDPSHTSR